MMRTEIENSDFGQIKEETNDNIKCEKDLKYIMKLNKWVVVSNNKHTKFQRYVIFNGEKSPTKQTYIRSVSPSNNSNSYKCIMRILRQQNNNVIKII